MMKAAALVLGFLAFAAPALAIESSHYTSTIPLQLTDPRCGVFYCQQTSQSWSAANASSGFYSEMADDLPDDFQGGSLTGAVFYVAEWGAGWVNPQSFTFEVFNGACPPEMNAVASFTVDWGQLDPVLVYSGDWTVYQITGYWYNHVYIGAHTTLGGFSNNNWGDSPPYCGLVVCDVVSGCGEGYWSAEYWGAPRWTPLSWYFGYEWDVAYCAIGFGTGVVPVNQTSWGRIRSIYR
jgi:hypothetical protein